MALGSQQAQAETLSGLAGLVHDTFYGRVLPNVRSESPVAQLFRDAGPGEYQLVGDTMRFAVDLNFATGALATDGKLPDHVGLDPVEGGVTPIRRYRRVALDNFIEKRISGDGAFDNLSDRIFDVLWNSWKYMECRHAIGGSSGQIGAAESRTSSTVFVIKDAFGNVGTNPLAHLSPGSLIAWYDVSAAGIGGAGAISSINYSTRAITMDSAATWEPSATLAPNDTIFFCTTNSSTADYFISERNLAPNGLGTIVDPTAGSTTVFSIAEAGANARWKPYRKASVTFDHLEVTEHWLQLGSKRGMPVSPATDEAITFPSNVAQLARSLMAFQQQAYTGGDLNGGYGKVTVSGMPITEDVYFYHDVFMTLWREGLYRVPLGGEADFFSEDGSMWARIADFDGKEAQVGEYMNTFCTNRGANSALTGIVTDVTDADFTSVPDY